MTTRVAEEDGGSGREKTYITTIIFWGGGVGERVGGEERGEGGEASPFRCLWVLTALLPAA